MILKVFLNNNKNHLNALFFPLKTNIILYIKKDGGN